MIVDFALELGREDETLELPWAAPDGGPQYYDLKRRRELLRLVEEARRVPELREFLAAMNSPASAFETAKCDVWSSSQMNPEEEVFGAKCKYGSYVDLLFSDAASRFSFPAHEALVKRIVELLKRVPQIPAMAEFVVRRGYYYSPTGSSRAEGAEHGAAGAEVREGFYVTFYLFGYGEDETTARQQWAIGMKLVENALKQISAAHGA